MNARRISLQIAAAALLLILGCIVYRLRTGNVCTYTVSNPGLPASEEWQLPPRDLKIEMEHEGIVAVEKVRIHENYIEVFLRAVSEGSTDCVIRNAEDQNLDRYVFFEVDRWLGISCNGIFYTGMGAVIFAVGLFLAFVSFIFLFSFFKIRGSGMYSYGSIFCVGLAIFTGIGATGIFKALIEYAADPYLMGLPTALDSIWNIPETCMIYLTIPMLIFSAAMVISNVELLRHERFRVANIYGILIPVAMILGEALPYLVSRINFSGSFETYRRLALFFQIYITCYVYFECILAGSVICGLRAAGHHVDWDKDYIIILGCRFRADGTLTPLLKGRCDRAVGFWNEQKEKSGKEAVIIPSGGQGPDESMPESEAMARYLLNAGIPEQNIVCEDRSKNTYQNMQFSREIIEKGPLPAKTVYATTNYHLFRSGVWAHLAGLDAEGIGSSTKWWFWPNAFMRECIGLLANRVRQEIILLVIMVAVNTGLLYLIMQ